MIHRPTHRNLTWRQGWRASRRVGAGATIALVTMLLVGAVAGGGYYLYSHRPMGYWQEGLQAIENKDIPKLKKCAEALKGTSYVAQYNLLQGVVYLSGEKDEDGNLLFKDHNAKALECFGLARENTDTKFLAYKMSGQALYNMGRFQDAENAFLNAIDLNYIDPQVRMYLAMAYFEIGAYSKALPQFQVAGINMPESGRAHRMMGLIFYNMKEFDHATEAYTESIARDPNQPDINDIRLEMATAQADANKCEDALKTLAECPEDLTTLVLAARCFYATGEQTKSEECIAKILAQDPENAPAMMFKADMEMDVGSPAKAIPLYEKVADSFKSDPIVRFKLMQAYMRTGQQDKAEKLSAQVEESRTKMIEFFTLHEQAAQFPHDAEIRFRIAKMHFDFNERDQGVQWLMRALAVDPNHPQALVLLQKLADEKEGQDSKTGSKEKDSQNKESKSKESKNIDSKNDAKPAEKVKDTK